VRLTEKAARTRLASAPVVRLGTVCSDGRPHVVVTAFVLDDDHIYTAVDQKPKTTRDLKRLRNIRANPRVTALADWYEDDWSALWWVRADGRASILDRARDMADPIRLLMDRYPQYRQAPPDGPVIAITIDRLTGWTAGEA